MTDRERRLLDAAKEADRALKLMTEVTGWNSTVANSAREAIAKSLQEYFGSERQDT